MSNSQFEKALRSENMSTPPIWFMRQAGRYHQHYQNLKKSHSFWDLCVKPEWACETTLGPIQDFDFDVAILFSDLLFPLDVMGMGLSYPEGKGPQLEWHLDESNFSKLKNNKDDFEKLLFQKEALKLLKQKLPAQKSLIGFVGSPWTLFCYAVDGSHSGSMIDSKRLLPLFPKFCEIMVPLLKKNIQLQLEGGAEIVTIFDTAAGELDPKTYNQYVVPFLSDLSKTFPKKLGFYSKWTSLWHYEALLAQSSKSWAGLGFDHRFYLPDCLKRFSTEGFVQGNFDQTLLFLDTPLFKEKLDLYLNEYERLSSKERASWVCGLGHGVLPKTPEAHVKYFVQRVRERFK